MKRAVLMLAALTFVIFLNAQTPINDEYTGALEVTPSTDAFCIYTFGTTIGSTQSLPGCYGSAEDDIWFKFTATSNRHRIIVTGDPINHVLELFTFSSGNLTSLACRYKTAPSEYGYLSTEIPDLIPGTTYYYRVYGAGSTSQRGQISNCITSPPPPPANDECTGAIELTVNSNNVCTSIYSGKFGNASQSLPAFVDKGSEVFDVWFKFMATATSHKIRLTHANFFPPLMEVFAGNCSNLVSLKHFAPPYQSQPQPLAGVLYNLTPGNTYYIRVYQDGGIVRPDQILNLCITSPPFETEGYKFPIVSLTSPADGAVFTAPTSVSLSAIVAEGEEPIQKVEFFYSEYQRGDTKLGEDLTAPYEYTWNDAFPGHYTIIAKAIDKAGATGISGSTITINPPPTNQPPTLNFSAYTLGSGFAPATVFLNGMATDADGKIIKVELSQNGQLIFPSMGPNFSFGFSGLNSGFYHYEAKAIDDQGSVAVAHSFVIVHEPLTVSLTSPANNASFTALATISLEATPSGGDGTFSKVEFYNGTTKLGEDLTAPYTFNWTNVAAGTYSLTAKVFHSMGDNAASNPVTITVSEPANQLPNISLTAPVNGASLPAPATVTLTAVASDVDGSITKVEFYNGASKIGEDFTAPYQYEWNGISAGFYSLTAKAIDNRGGISTSAVVSITILNPVNQPPIVSLNTPLITYGPTNADPVTILLQATASDTDGSIAKVEFYQNGMPIGVAMAPPYHAVSVVITSGSYIFTARAYDNLGAISEMSVTVPVQRAPRVILNSPANGTIFTAPATVNLSAIVDKGDGVITKVEFYNGTTKLGEDLTAPYTLSWNNVGVGTYTVTAKVSDDQVHSTFSPDVKFAVEAPANQPPTVTLTAPAAGSSFTAPATISLTATASDVDGTISKVEFYNGSTKIGEDLTAPFEFGWNGVSAGIYSLTAKAIDNRGGMSTSTAVSVTVLEPSAVTFTLVNSTNDLDVQTLKDGDSINLASLSGTNLNIRANSASPIGSMVFNLSGAQTVNQTESVAPYALFGDNGGDYNDWTPAVGNYTLQATPFSEGGGTGTAGTAATINFKVVNIPANAIPVANAGADKVVTQPASTTTLNGSGSDANGSIAGYAWTQVSGPNTATITPNAAAQSPTVGSLVAGTYVFSLIVTDNQSAASTPDLVTVSVVSNTIPVASAGADKVVTQPASSTTLNGSGSDANGSIAGYAWTQVSGPNTATITPNAAAQSPTVGSLVAGTYVFSLIVTDNQGAASTPDLVTVSVVSNTIPVANAGADKVVTQPASTTTLNGSGSDANGSIAGYAWTQVSGPNTATITPNAAAQSPTVGSLVAGTYVFSLIVTDNQGAASTPDLVTVSVVNNNDITLTLVNSTNDLDIQTLKDGDSINLATLSSTNLNIRANSASSIGSIVFNLSGAQTVNQTESVAPYALFGDNGGDYNDWTPAVGNYTLKATPFSEGGGTGTAGTAATINFKVINKAINLPLSIGLTSPASGSNFTAPATINLAATPSGGDGTFSKVEFYNGTTKLGEDLTAPYTFNWTNVAAGSYSLTAKVFHSAGNNATSNPVTITVNEPANQPPTVSLTAPVSGASLPAPATVTLTAVAYDADGSITKVEFYNGSSKIGEDITAPYQYEWSGISAGTYVLTAKAIDNRGGISTSTAVFITVSEPDNQLPTVNLTSPANGASFNAPASINLTATASDADGTISKVEFYNGTTKLGEDLVAPYEYTWSGVTTGNYSLSAKAIDNMGGVSSSNTASVSVVTPPAGGTLVNKNSVWKYNDKGVDLGSSWTALNYNDASWSSGPGVLGYGTPVASTLSYGSNKNNKYPSYYFRRSFEITDASIYTTLVFNIRRDDGAVVYLNGVEQFRTNMPGGIVGYNSFASSDLNGPDQSNYFSFRIAASQLRAGTNVIAVSVHQSDRRSADMSFDMEVIAETTSANQLPIARISTVDNTGSKEDLEKTEKSRLLVKAIPNPSTSYFTLLLQSNRLETVDIRVVDAMGRLVETRRKLPATATVKFGYNYRPGIYFAEVIQGTQRTTVKLIKGKD